MRRLILALVAAGLAGCAAQPSGSPGRIAQPKGDSHFAPERTAIYALRAANNRAIERRDLAAILSTLTPDSVFFGGGGDVESGIDAIRAGWTQEFARPGFVRYVRTSVQIDVGDGGARAAESGTWLGVFNRTGGEARPRGTYLTHWIKSAGQWRMRAEMYVTLGCDGPGCTPPSAQSPN